MYTLTIASLHSPEEVYSNAGFWSMPEANPGNGINTPRYIKYTLRTRKLGNWITIESAIYLRVLYDPTLPTGVLRLGSVLRDSMGLKIGQNATVQVIDTPPIARSVTVSVCRDTPEWISTALDGCCVSRGQHLLLQGSDGNCYKLRLEKIDVPVACIHAGITHIQFNVLNPSDLL